MKPYKKDSPFSYSIGVFPTIELLQTHPQKVERVLLSSKGHKNSGVLEIETLCQKHQIKTEYADGEINKLSESENTYALGVFQKYHSSLEKGKHLVLVNPSDKGNLGTIIRTMLAYGVKNLGLISPAVDIFDPKTIRASMGAVFKINFAYFPSFEKYQEQFSQNFYPFLTNGKTLLPEAKFQTPFSLIFGNEGSGLDEEYLRIGESIKIPQSSEVDSLNLSIAVGIGLYTSSLN